jgi:hypothetical protein
MVIKLSSTIFFYLLLWRIQKGQVNNQYLHNKLASEMASYNLEKKVHK